MSDERYGLDDLNAIPAGATTNGVVDERQLKVVTLGDFIAVTDDVVAPLVGTSREALLPAGGMLLMYGDGGAGKTVLSIDALAHFASATEWLGQPVPEPLKVMLIENEGPRGPFRELLNSKVDGWEGEPFLANVSVLEEPWTRFTLSDTNYRGELAEEIDLHQADLLMLGPLASLGVEGGGTPEEVNRFGALLADLKQRCLRDFATWIVHHENKQGNVSGAWERIPDTLVNVSAQGNGHTRVHWRKVRWSSLLHNTSLNLLWGDNGGFTLDTKASRDYPAELLQAFRDHPFAWRTVSEAKALIGAGQDAVTEALHQLTVEGHLTFEIGPPGRKSHARCWHLTTHLETQSQFGSDSSPDVLVTQLTSSPTPVRGEEESGEITTGSPTNSPEQSQYVDDGDEIPF